MSGILTKWSVLQRQHATAADLDLRWTYDDLPAAALPGRPESLVLTATATEIWPTAFAISVRIRPIDDDSDRALNVVCKIELRDATTGDAYELETAVRDELIALEHAARHFN